MAFCTPDAGSGYACPHYVVTALNVCLLPLSHLHIHQQLRLQYAVDALRVVQLAWPVLLCNNMPKPAFAGSFSQPLQLSQSTLPHAREGLEAARPHRIPRRRVAQEQRPTVALSRSVLRPAREHLRHCRRAPVKDIGVRL